MNTIIEHWSEILLRVKTERDMTDKYFSTWLEPLKIHKIENNIITIVVSSGGQIALDYIQKKCSLFLQVAICETANITDCTIEFILPENIPNIPPETSVLSCEEASIARRCQEANLNPKYTFDTFIVGNNNKFAHTAALAIAESPGTDYNPLFIYGGSGLGKTHLMHSIGHFIIKNNPDSKVLYTTSEEFTRELINSLLKNNSPNANDTAMTQFREKYRNIDVLLIDDIQFIIGKDSTQEEFFHTFNSLYNAKKQIVISSDKPPRDMEILEERFLTRFQGGVLTDIKAPDYETRMAILHKKEEINNYFMKKEIIEYMATNIQSSIRELEGAFNKLVALSKLEGKELTMELAEHALKDIISPKQKKNVSPAYIISVVSEHFNVTPEDLAGSKRNAKIVTPRQIAMYLCRELTNISLKTIGKHLGKRDHTTVIHGIEKIEKALKTDPNLKNTVAIIKKKINPL